MTKIIHNPNSYPITVMYNNNKIEVLEKSITGKETIMYNNLPVPSVGSFGSITNVFVAVEMEKYVQYDVEITLRWHCMSFYTTIKRQKIIIYSDK